ncbi:hypothetical protein HK405_002760, partial [Cladochytrium tenue]
DSAYHDFADSFVWDVDLGDARLDSVPPLSLAELDELTMELDGLNIEPDRVSDKDKADDNDDDDDDNGNVDHGGLAPTSRPPNSVAPR